jgi:hypothetical protein
MEAVGVPGVAPSTAQQYRAKIVCTRVIRR